MATSLEEKELQGLLARLRRIEGQIRGLQRMVREGADCREVLQQFAAAKSALEKASLAYFLENLSRCLSQENETEKRLSQRELEEIFLKLI